MYYAQLTNGVVTAVTETSGIIDAPHMVEITSLDASLLGNTYANGVFTRQATRKNAILIRLMEIDATTDKPRTRRELQLNKAATKTWLQTLDDEAVALRTELAGL